MDPLIHVIGRNTLNISEEYTNLKEQGELKFAFNRCFEDWKSIGYEEFIRNSSFLSYQ